MDAIDNTRLNQLLELNQNKMTLDELAEFIDLLQNSKLILPLEEDEDLLDLGFPLPLILFTSSDESITPLFTDKKQLKHPDMETVCLDMEDIMEFLDNFGVEFIVLNPFGENKTKFRVKSLLNNDLEKKLEFMCILRRLFYNHSITLSKPVELYRRSEKPLNEINPKMPFSVTSDKHHDNHLPYLNILKLSSGDKLMPAELVFKAGKPDHIFLAPETEFELVDKKDENTFVWKCVRQPFYK